MRSHLRISTEFCDDLGITQFQSKRQQCFVLLPVLPPRVGSYGTIQNHISSIKHFHSSFGYPPPPPGGIIRMSFSLRYAGVNGCLGLSQHVNYRSLLLYFCVWLRCLTVVAPFTPLCGLSSLLHFFSFLRKSNLVVPNPNVTFPKVPVQSPK